MGFLDNAGVDRLWKKFKNHIANYLPLTGGTMKGLLNVPYGTAVHGTYGTQGSPGYVHLATIVIEDAYTNAPIEMTIARRNDRQPTKIVVKFYSANSTDPTLETFSVFGATADVWIYKSATSTWELCVQKSTSYDRVDVTEYHNPTYNDINVTWQKDMVSTLPDGAIQATVREFLGVASKSTGVVDYNNESRNIQIGYSGNSLGASELAYIAGYDHEGKIKDASKDAVKAYLGISDGILPKYNSEYNWKSKDPVLLAGEMAISNYSTSGLNDFKYKVGDGTSKWSELPYAYTNGIALLTSGNSNKNKWIKFATIDLSKTGAWIGCSGFFKFCPNEAGGAIGILKFQFRVGSTAGTISRENLIWLSLNSPDYANSVCAVTTGDGTRDLYYKPITDYESMLITATDVYNARPITMQTDNTYVASVTPVITSYVSSYATYAETVNGHTVNADVPSDAKFTDTTYSAFRGTEGMSDGTSGLVPAPKASEFGNSYALGSDGKWRDFEQTFVSQSFAEGAYATNDALENAIKELKKYVDTQSSGGVTLDSVYPVGSIYISVNDSFNPNDVFPGTWVSFGKGRTLVGVDRSDLEFQSSEDTGGEKTHTLTVEELPAHDHGAITTVKSKSLTGKVWNFAGQGASNGPGNSTSGVFSKGGDANCFYPSATKTATGISDGFTLDATHDHTASTVVGNTGSGTAHNNMMPYITVYMWKRTA